MIDCAAGRYTGAALPNKEQIEADWQNAMAQAVQRRDSFVATLNALSGAEEEEADGEALPASTLVELLLQELVTYCASCTEGEGPVDGARARLALVERMHRCCASIELGEAHLQTLLQLIETSDDPGKKTPFCAPCLCLKLSFCQDRLGTNVGKVEKKEMRFRTAMEAMLCAWCVLRKKNVQKTAGKTLALLGRTSYHLPRHGSGHTKQTGNGTFNQSNNDQLTVFSLRFVFEYRRLRITFSHAPPVKYDALGQVSYACFEPAAKALMLRYLEGKKTRSYFPETVIFTKTGSGLS
eukprot:COSAG06_NODE_84_length_25090_cov_20.561042_19_plen_295_part_00